MCRRFTGTSLAPAEVERVTATRCGPPQGGGAVGLSGGVPESPLPRGGGGHAPCTPGPHSARPESERHVRPAPPDVPLCHPCSAQHAVETSADGRGTRSRAGAGRTPSPASRRGRSSRVQGSALTVALEGGTSSMRARGLPRETPIPAACATAVGCRSQRGPAPHLEQLTPRTDGHGARPLRRGPP